MKRIPALLLAVLLLASTCSAQSLPTNKFHQKVWAATFALYGYAPAVNIGHFVCTATVISKSGNSYKLLTASHCVNDDDLPSNLKFYVSETLIPEDPAAIQKLTPAAVLVEKRDNEVGLDFAVLEITSPKSYPVIPLGNEAVLKVESKVFAVNFSEGVAKQLNKGTVSSQIMTGHGVGGDCHNCSGRFLIQTYGAGGSSGAAIVDEKTHKIVGIIEGGYSDGSSEIVPISHLKQLTY
jgi:trypsin-like peptidase